MANLSNLGPALRFTAAQANAALGPEAEHTVTPSDVRRTAQALAKQQGISTFSLMQSPKGRRDVIRTLSDSVSQLPAKCVGCPIALHCPSALLSQGAGYLAALRGG